MMPGMNGVELLEKVRELTPDITRILLTGVAALDMAVEAVNRGSIFRFLLKPCSTETFTAAVKDGVRQYQLITGEKELLSKTLSGSIKVMIDILAAVSPEVFARVGRLRKLAQAMTEALQLPDLAWEIELSALLSQIGAVTIPRYILQRWQKGTGLDLTEREMVNAIPRIGSQLIHNIPRLEGVANAVAYQDCSYSTPTMTFAPIGENIPVAARILKIIIDYDRYLESLHAAPEAFHLMLQHKQEYDPQMLDVFEEWILKADRSVPTGVAKQGERKILVDDLKAGMELSRDIIDKNGILIVAKGTVITEVLRYKLSNFFRSHAMGDPVFIESDF